jgi:hypothetical protein
MNERVIALIADGDPRLVWDFFKARLRFKGGRLLHAVFPIFMEAFGKSLSAVVSRGGTR